jgi:GcrA cell cycle regulator
MSWTDERVARPRKLYADGFSGAKIAAELGAGVTRNAVIGKIERMGLNDGSHARKPRVSARVAKALAPPKIAEVSRSLDEARAIVVAVAVDAPAPIGGVTLFAARENHCRWPLGDPRDLETFRFCGAAKFGEASYCRAHAALAFRPAATKWRPRARRPFMAEGV